MATIVGHGKGRTSHERCLGSVLSLAETMWPNRERVRSPISDSRGGRRRRRILATSAADERKLRPFREDVEECYLRGVGTCSVLSTEHFALARSGRCSEPWDRTVACVVIVCTVSTSGARTLCLIEQLLDGTARDVVGPIQFHIMPADGAARTWQLRHPPGGLVRGPDTRISLVAHATYGTAPYRIVSC